MPNDINTHIFLLFLPLIIANVIHMLIVKKDIFSNWAIPISAKLFGNSKTWRGLIFLPMATAFLCWLFNVAFLSSAIGNSHSLFLGLGLGLSYMVWELPNSFVKRRLGIANGQKSKKSPLLQVFTDKADSLLGVLLFYYLVMPVSFLNIVVLFALSMGIHLVLSYLLYALKIKKSF